MIWYTTPCLYSVAWILPPLILPVNTSVKLNSKVGSTANDTNKLALSLFKINEVEVSCWIAISPARAPSILKRASWSATVYTLNGLNGGIWSNEIFPESVSSTNALGTAFVEYGLLIYGPKLFVI